MSVILILVLLLLTGCPITKSSGVLQLGPDTYTVSTMAVPGAGGSTEARRMALTEANAHCASINRQILVTNMGSSSPYGAPGKAEITFRCLAKDDPSLQRPVFQQAPDVTIEDRRK
jgi:hypothetical protein